jgi:hypothetical protein
MVPGEKTSASTQTFINEHFTPAFPDRLTDVWPADAEVEQRGGTDPVRAPCIMSGTLPSFVGNLTVLRTERLYSPISNLVHVRVVPYDTDERQAETDACLEIPTR